MTQHFVCSQDICKPDPGRLRRNLSAIINFAKFREEKLAPYVEAQEEADALLDAQAALEEANAKLVRAHAGSLWRQLVVAGETDVLALQPVIVTVTGVCHIFAGSACWRRGQMHALHAGGGAAAAAGGARRTEAGAGPSACMHA
jgi:hypothetical protein